jgi:hypothetical protein
MELLGVGGILLQILLEGGINTDDIVKMALDALIVAIPIALVAILIEKLVSMIVPAAGAVLAIIEGLQAAWGTVSRIIAAFGAFMAFLQAVHGGGAGPLFATALAAAAIVLLDFVSNWLLKKLAGPAKKVGARLKGMGDKIKAKLKGKGGKGGKGKPKAHAKPTRKKKGDDDGPDGPRSANAGKKRDKDGPDKGKKKDKDEKDKSKDLAAVRRAAKQAASKGWAKAKSEAGRTAIAKAQLEQALASAEGVKNGIKVKVDADVQGNTWSVKATASKKSQTATSSAGRGPVLKSKAGGVFFASVDIKPVEKRVERMSRDQLKKADGDGEVDSKLRKIEAEGQRMLDGRLRGLDLSLQRVGGGEDVKVKALIQPNYYEWEVDEVGGDWEELKEEVDKRKGHRGRYNAELGWLQRLGDRFGAKVNFEHLSSPGQEFTYAIEVTFSKDTKKLVVWMNRMTTGPGKHEPTATSPGECALSGKDLALNSSGGPDATKRTKPHDALAGSTWRDIIVSNGNSILGSAGDVTTFINTIAAAAKATNAFMVGDGRSSQKHEYNKVGASTPNQSVEGIHHNTPIGERKKAIDAAPAGDDMEVTLSGSAQKAIIPKKDYAGEDWADMDQDETNAALRARISVAINGLRGIAAAELPVAGLDESKLPAFWTAVSDDAYTRGKW